MNMKKRTGVCNHGRRRPRGGWRPRRELWICGAVSIWLTGAVSVTAQVQSVAAVDPSESRPAKSASAVSVEVAPTLDGDVLGDPAWASLTPIDGFLQSAPDAGQPASERTEVRVVFTADTIFFGVVCYDRDPSAIIVTDSRRDSTLRNSDSFQLVLDTFGDQQNGFVFGTSPAGQEYDGQVINEGGGRGGFGGGGRGGFNRGSGGGFNLNWDGAWQVRTAISDVGWSAEFAIPFRTIRYPAREDQSWGVNFERSIRRRNETAFWAPIPRQFNLYRVSMAGELTGVQPPIGFTRNLQLTPYVIGELATLDERPGEGSMRSGAWGSRPQIQRDVRAYARRDLQHRFRAGRGRRPANQPRPIQSVLSGEASVLPRERRRVYREQLRPCDWPELRTDRAVLQSANRDQR